jgi:multidrug transporter EmrE-like cation transporter
MSHPKIWISTLIQTRSPLIFGLFALNVVLSVIANSSFKVSADSSNWRGLLLWQIIGNLTGFLSVLALTGLYRYIPLHVAHPISMGLAVVGVQVIGAKLIFQETITITQGMGTFLVVLGIIFIGMK